MITLHFAQLFSKNNAALTSDPEAAHLMLSPSAHVHRLTLFKSTCTWLTRGTYQLKLAFLPTGEPHPWLSFHMC